MQQISLNIRNNKGGVIKESSINFAEVMKVIYSDSECNDKYPFLSSIDPYDDTSFTHLQVERLIKELSLIPEKNSSVQESISFLKLVGQFEYAEFIGD